MGNNNELRCSSYAKYGMVIYAKMEKGKQKCFSPLIPLRGFRFSELVFGMDMSYQSEQQTAYPIVIQYRIWNARINSHPGFSSYSGRINRDVPVLPLFSLSLSRIPPGSVLICLRSGLRSCRMSGVNCIDTVLILFVD